MKKDRTITYVLVILLVAAEQLIKVFINNNYLHSDFPILKPILYFRPMFNRDYSWINSMLGLGITKWFHIAVVATMITFIFLFYRYLSIRNQANKMLSIMFSFLMAGALCSLLDKVLWNGSLDYIELKNFFTFDLKDIYIDIFIALTIFTMLFHDKAFKQFEDKNIFKDFGRYFLRRK